MKTSTITLILILVSTLLTAQNTQTKPADKLVERYEYVQAVQEYLKLVDNGKSDSYVQKQLGDCYYNIYNPTEAIKWYQQAVSSGKQDPETYYRYAQMLKSDGKYEASNAQMKTFAAMLPTDSRAKIFNENPDYLPKLIDTEKLFDVEKISINSERSDFGGVLYGNQLYFSSARNETLKKYGWNDEPFLDLYQSTYDSAQKKYTEPTAITVLNTRFHEGPLTMTQDGNTIYYSSESFNENLFEKDKTKKLKYGQVNLYTAKKENGKWTAIKPLPFNSKSYSTSNPSIDTKGTTLYFSSNMPGSKGGIDIWKVAVNADGTFGTPENMGDKINTAGDESFPFIEDDSVLFFASNGLTGFGGFDVFSIDLKTNSAAVNLGKPVNTEKDDFAFTFNTAHNSGYVSSNRSGVDHIYSAIPVCKGQIETIVKNAKTGALLPNAKVVIMDEAGNVLDTKFTNGNAEVLYDTECKPYTIAVYKDGFVTKNFPVANLEGGKKVLEANIDPIEVIVTETEIILNPIYFEYDKSNITKQGATELDKLVYVMSQNDKLVIFAKSHTDFRGNDAYNMKLSDRRAQATVQYVISKGIDASRITGQGFGESEPKVNCVKCTEKEHAQNRRSEFMIIKK